MHARTRTKIYLFLLDCKIINNNKRFKYGDEPDEGEEVSVPTLLHSVKVHNHKACRSIAFTPSGDCKKNNKKIKSNQFNNLYFYIFSPYILYNTQFYTPEELMVRSKS